MVSLPDPEVTPRAPRKAVKSTSSRSQSKSTQSRRSAGPTKQKTDLEIMYPRIKFIEGKQDLSHAERGLMVHIVQASKVFPLALKAKLEEHPGSEWSLMFNAAIWMNNPNHPYTEAQIQYLWDTAAEIEDAARECSVEQQPEES